MYEHQRVSDPRGRHVALMHPVPAFTEACLNCRYARHMLKVPRLLLLLYPTRRTDITAELAHHRFHVNLQRLLFKLIAIE